MTWVVALVAHVDLLVFLASNSDCALAVAGIMKLLDLQNQYYEEERHPQQWGKETVTLHNEKARFITQFLRFGGRR